MTKFDPINFISAPHSHPICLIWTKFGMDILIDHRNQPAEEFFIFLKIQDGRRWSKIDFRQNFGSKITFWLGKWISFIRFGQNLAGTYYSLGTSPRNNFDLSQNLRWLPRPPLRQITKSVIT